MSNRSLRRSRAGISIVALAAGTLALTACSSTITTAATTSASPSASAGDTLTLVTYDSYAISKKVLKDFQDQTGITVKVSKGGDAAEMVNRALLTKDNPEGDVLFGVDNNILQRAVDGGLFSKYVAANADRIPQQYQLDPSGTVTPIDYGDVCINYDKAWYEQKGLTPPASLDDLKKAEYRDQLVAENPATSTPGLAFLLATVAKYGADGFSQYWQDLRNNGVQVDNSWDTAYGKDFTTSGGDRPLVVSYSSSPVYEALYGKAKAKDGSAPTGNLLDSCYRQVEFAGVLANAKNPVGAQKLVDFMLTKTYQDDLPLQDFVYPVMPDATLPKAFTDNAQTASNPLVVPADQVNANRDAWVQTWTDVVER